MWKNCVHAREPLKCGLRWRQDQPVGRIEVVAGGAYRIFEIWKLEQHDWDWTGPKHQFNASLFACANWSYLSLTIHSSLDNLECSMEEDETDVVLHRIMVLWKAYFLEVRIFCFLFHQTRWKKHTLIGILHVPRWGRNESNKKYIVFGAYRRCSAWMFILFRWIEWPSSPICQDFRNVACHVWHSSYGVVTCTVTWRNNWCFGIANRPSRMFRRW